MIGSGAAIGSVPTTAEMVTYFEKSISSDAEDAAAFAQLVRGLPPQEQYQAGAQFLIDHAGLNHLNRVIRGAVLRARSPRINPELSRQYVRNEETLRELEEDTTGWAIPQGISALARLLARVPSTVRGPILTTNFDPLVEVSLRAAGLDPFTIISDGDGSVQAPSSTGTVIPVVHLHGFWRTGDTLHTSVQLGLDRPKLLGSLRQILSSSTLIVLGYGGWDDILTHAILQVVREGGQRDLEVLWGCHGSQMSMGAVSGADLPGRIQPYVSVDCNHLIPEVLSGIESRLRTTEPAVSTPRRPSLKVAGCTTIGQDFINIQTSRTTDPAIALTYFDGRHPSWVDVVSGRAAARQISEDVAKSLHSNNPKPIILLEGPTGEGKSTILRQVALRLVERGQDLVLWADAGGTIDAQEVLGLTAIHRRIVVLMDDADLRVKEIRALYSEARARNRGDITLLLAARDTDWQRSTFRFGMSIPNSDLDRRLVSGMSEDDAARIVSSWSDFGPAGLGRLVEVTSSAERAQRLYKASLEYGSSALLGAMLATRYGIGFREHIRELLARLERVELPSGGSLLDAYLVICLQTSLSLEHVRIEHLSWFTQLSVPETLSLVIGRLGREAAAERHGDEVVPRHTRIAQVACELASEFGRDLGDIQSRLVGSVVKNVKGQKWTSEILSVVYSGQRLEDESLAIRSVDAAAQADPIQLRLTCSQVGVYRKFGHFALASRTCDTAWKSIDNTEDTKIALRPFLREWARAEGQQNRWKTSSALNACSLLDIPGIEDLDYNNACRAMSGLAVSIQALNLDDKVKAVDWVRTLAEVTLDLRPEEQLKAQAERTLGRATRDGYAGTTGHDVRAVVGQAIRFAVNSASVGPANRYRRFSGMLESLWQML